MKDKVVAFPKSPENVSLSREMMVLHAQELMVGALFGDINDEENARKASESYGDDQKNVSYAIMGMFSKEAL
jgi:hypothetical protein